MPDASINNPVSLKLRLMIEGVAAIGSAPAETLELIVADELWVRARVNPESELVLVDGSGSSAMRAGDAEWTVRIVPAAEFASRRNARGIPIGDIAAMRGTYVTIALGGGCGLSVAGRSCSICRGRELTEKAGELWPLDEVVEAVRAAFDEGDAEFVHFVLGFFPGNDGGLSMLRPYLDAVHRHFDTIVAVTMHPPADVRAIDLTYAAGADLLNYNLEAADESAMRLHLPGRANYFGRTRYLRALAHAARIFPSGAVWSELLMDLAPRPAVESAIRELTSIGVMPLLGIANSSGLELSSASGMAAVLFNEVVRSGISLNWARDVSTSMTPLDARYLVPDAPQLPVLHQLSRNRLGAMTTRSLARLRRRLRVKRVRASFDSSRL